MSKQRLNKQLRKLGFSELNFHTGDAIMNYVVGPNNGPPLVFIHGQSVTWEEYTYLMPRLCHRFRVYAVTLRGHGKSSWTPGRYTFNQLGRDMTAFLRDVVREPAVVAGNSSGGVLTAWLAAYAPEHVKAIVLEDPPLFRCDWPNIKTTAVYDTWLAFTRMSIAGGGGYARFFGEHVAESARQAAQVMNTPLPPGWLMSLMTKFIALQQALAPGKPVDFWFLPDKMRIITRGSSQFDGNFSRAFVDGTAGEGFDHAQTLKLIRQPVLFLHANFFTLEDGRLMGAINDEDVARIRELVEAPFKYVRMDCGHVIALEEPAQEAAEILAWYEEQRIAG
jgi:pimeloyl-ACP methyl ester carboxylesterase